MLTVRRIKRSKIGVQSGNQRLCVFSIRSFLCNLDYHIIVLRYFIQYLNSLIAIGFPSQDAFQIVVPFIYNIEAILSSTFFKEVLLYCPFTDRHNGTDHCYPEIIRKLKIEIPALHVHGDVVFAQT